MKTLYIMIFVLILAVGDACADQLQSLEEYLQKSLAVNSVEVERKQFGADIVYRLMVISDRKTSPPFGISVLLFADEFKSTLESGLIIARWRNEEGKIFETRKWIDKQEAVEIVKRISDEELFNLPESSGGRDDAKRALLSQTTLIFERARHDGKWRIFRHFETEGPAGRVRTLLLNMFDGLAKSEK